MHNTEAKPYRRVPIAENGEPLVAVEGEHLVMAEPHPYMAAGAPYGGVSPWYLRKSVVEGLNAAAEALQVLRPGWKIYLHDALRPVAVQFYMVEYELKKLARAEGIDPENIAAEDRARLMTQVLTIWAIPSEDPATPPPHSTGGTFDCTLVDRLGNKVPMGGEIDEMGPAQLPDHYIGVATQEGRRYHANRSILNMVLAQQGFERHPDEWWHFSRGDQLWAWMRQQKGEKDTVAHYGRAPGA